MMFSLEHSTDEQETHKKRVVKKVMRDFIDNWDRCANH